MTSLKGHGCKSVPDPEEFHAMMRRLYQEQRKPPEERDRSISRYDNSSLVQAKLPSALYTKFYQLLKEQNWSKSTGVQYAIYKLLEQQQ